MKQASQRQSARSRRIGKNMVRASVADSGAPDVSTFRASSGLRLLVPGGWVHSDDAPRVRLDPTLLVAAHAEARAAGADVSLQAQRRAADAEAAEREASQAQSVEVPPGFRFEPLAEALKTIRPPQWLVRGILERDTLAMLFGDPGTGKSFAAVDLAAAVATGEDWHGHKVPHPGAVLYIAGEGRSGLMRRFQAWSIARGESLDWAPLFLSTSAVSLTDWPNVADVLEAAQRAYRESGVAPVLIVVDTVARNFGPGDENSTADMTGFIRGCDELRQTFGACVLLVHHSGHADKSRARGAMALKGALDAEFRLDRDEANVIRLESTKVKDHEPPPPLAFKLATVDLGITDDEGQPVTSAVLRPVSWEPVARVGKAGRGKHQTLGVQLLRDALAMHRRNLQADGRDASTARVTVAAWKDACAEAGIDRRRLTELLISLKDQGRVRVEQGFIWPEGNA